MAGEQFSLRLVINGSNDGALAALNQVVERANATGGALARADTGNFSKTRNGLVSISTQLARAQELALGFASLAVVGKVATDLVRVADEMKGVESRVKLASGSLLEFNGNLAAIRATARESGTEVASVAALFNRIATPIKDMGGTAGDAQNAIKAVGQALRISGASAGESSAAMLQFAQALGSGALRGEELNSILENAPRLAQALAAGLGVTVGELKKLGEQGSLTSQQVLKALQSQQGALASEAARLPQTVSQAWTNLGEAVKQYVGEADKAAGTTAAIASGLSSLAANLPAIAAGVKDVALLIGVAFGANRALAVAAVVGAKREAAVATRVLAGEELRGAEAAMANAQAIRQVAVAQLAAIATARTYATSAEVAALADERRAAAARLVAANAAVGAAGTALVAAQSAAAAANIGLMGRAMGLAATAGRGLLAVFGGWPGLIITGVAAAALAWDHFRAKTKKTEEDTGASLAAMAKQAQDFAGKMGAVETERALEGLKGKAAEAREKLQSPLFRNSDEGRKLAADLKVAEEAIDSLENRVTTFTNNRNKERGLLGLDKLKIDAGGLVDQDTLKSLQAFDALYKDFVAGAVGDNNRLKASALEMKAALEGLFAQAKTPAEFTGLVERIGTALRQSPNSATLQSQLENAIEARSQAELKSLNGLAAGLEARAARTQALFSQAANIALAQFNQASALAKVAAELRNDPAGAVKVEVNTRSAEVVAAKTAADQQIAALEAVAERKRRLAEENSAAVKGQARDEIDAVKSTQRQKLIELESAVAKGTLTEAQAADERAKLAKKTVEDTNQALAARGQAEANAARQIREVDAQTAQQRAAIAQNLYDTLKAKAAEALNAYKGYAQQVIDLDKQIVGNRLNTAAAVGNLQRQGLTPREQGESLRQELEQVKRETNAALAEGKNDFARELLQRQQGLANSLGNLSGEGVDQKAQREEGIRELLRIGQETDGILREQRAAAEESAARQLEQFNQMTQAMNGLAKQITALNEQAAIKLKPEIVQGSLTAALDAVKTAFAGLVLPLKVQATGLPDGAVASQPDLPARAYGGPLPGHAPHDRADNMLYLGTPGEWVIDRPAVRYYGDAFMRDLLARRIPRFAFGGKLGGGVVSRLAIPSVSSFPAAPALAPANLHFPGVGSFSVETRPDVIDQLADGLARLALKRGGRR